MVVGQDHDLEQVLIETELVVSNVGNMTTLLKIVQICQRQSKSNRTTAVNASFQKA